MGKAPSVSIIIPVYNAEPYLRRCLDSVRAQTLTDWECICVDDGSVDRGGGILDEYAHADSRFVVIHKENGGISSARNAGLEAVRGEFIGFIDNDDWIEPETYELALNAARQTGADIVQWRYVAETKDGPRPSKEMPEGEFSLAESPERNSGMIWHKLFRASLVAERQIRFPLESKIGGEDFFFSDATYCYAKKAYSLNRILYHLDRTHVSTSTKIVTADEIMGHVAATKAACVYLECLADRAAGKERKRAINNIIFGQKLSTKGKALSCMEPPNWRLYFSVFPELNRTKQTLIAILRAWRLGWLVMAIVWAKGRLRQLKLAQSS